MRSLLGGYLLGAAVTLVLHLPYALGPLRRRNAFAAAIALISVTAAWPWALGNLLSNMVKAARGAARASRRRRP